jgi:hypothetical protein
MKVSRSVASIVITCALMFLLGVSPGWTQGNVGFTLAGGLATPALDFNDWANLGFGVHGSFYVEVSPVSAVGIGIGYNRFGLDQDNYIYYDVDGGEPSILSICSEIRFMAGTGDMGTFAFIVGGGWYRLMRADMTTSASSAGDFDYIARNLEFDPQSELGVNVGGQALYPMSDTVKIGAETRFHAVFTDDETTTFFDFMAVLAITTGT